MVNENKTLEKAMHRLRGLMELISFTHLSEASDFSWVVLGKQSTSQANGYSDFANQLKSYSELQLQKTQIQSKLKYLLQKRSSLLMDTECYANFYHMVLNEIKTNGKDKIIKLVNNALDSYVSSITLVQIEEVSVGEGLTPKEKIKKSFQIKTKNTSTEKRHHSSSKSKIRRAQLE